MLFQCSKNAFSEIKTTFLEIKNGINIDEDAEYILCMHEIYTENIFDEKQLQLVLNLFNSKMVYIFK